MKRLRRIRLRQNRPAPVFSKQTRRDRRSRETPFNARVLQGESCTLFPTGTQTIRNRSSNAVAAGSSTSILESDLIHFLSCGAWILIPGDTAFWFPVITGSYSFHYLQQLALRSDCISPPQDHFSRSTRRYILCPYDAWVITVRVTNVDGSTQ